jgi:2-phospho-L-lactate guanylyltransferase
MNTAWALVPLKPLADAKTRLAPALSRAECAEVSLHMAEDVVAALTGAGLFAGVSLLTADPIFSALGRRFGCRILEETPGRDWCQSLALAAADLAATGVGTLLVVPGDLPQLTAPVVSALMSRAGAGVTLCPAERDGGTNAIVLRPPDAIPLLFGHDSARRHLEAAERLGIHASRVVVDAIGRDIDTPADLQWLCGTAPGGRTHAYLERSGIAARLTDTAAAAVG